MPNGTVTMRSPITGKLTVYTLHNWLNCVEGNSVVDVELFCSSMNDEFYTQGIDALCNEVKHINSPIAGWIQVSTYVSEASLAEEKIAVPILGAILAIIKWAIVLAVVVGGTIYAVSWALHKWRMEEAYPSLYFVRNPDTGEIEGPYPRETAVTLNQAYYPNMWVDPNTTLPFDPTDPDFEAKKEWIIMNTPSGWGEPKTYGFDIGSIVTWLIIGGVAIGGIYVAAKILPGMLKKKD